MAAETDKPSPHPRNPSNAQPLRFPMVLLRHDTAGGHHYDWLITNPHTVADPAAKLWTARVGHPSSEWAKLERWEIEHIGDHRRDYLTYEGPLSGNRGSVRRVDEGTFAAKAWTENHIELDVAMRDFCGVIEIKRRVDNHWESAVRRPARG